MVAEEHNTVRQCDSKSLIKGSKTLKPMLKRLYCLLCSSLSYNVTGDYPGTSATEIGLNIKLDTVTLSSFLLEELCDRLSFSSPLTSVDQDTGLALLHVDARNSMEEMLLLVRCCVLMVRLHPDDLSLLEKLRDAVALLGLLPFREAVARLENGSIRFPEVTFSRSRCSGCTCSSSTALGAESSNSYVCLLKPILEVFLDEMLSDRLLREFIATLQSFFFEEKLSGLSSLRIETVLDAVAAHFLLSISREKSLETFTQSLTWMQKQTLYAPELSLTAAISLVKHPVMSSSILLHAHLVSLVSEVIGISLSKVGHNIRYTEIYLSAFHDSVTLYCGLLSQLLPGSSSIPCKQQKAFWKHFKQPDSDVYDKINLLHSGWENSWRAHIGKIFTKTNSNLASDAISYLDMNISILTESSRSYVSSFLSSLVRVVTSEVNEVLLHRIKELTMQDFCLLASIMKLMSSSMLQAIHCLNKSYFKSSSQKKDAFASLVGVMRCVRHYNIHLPGNVQQIVVDAMKSHLSTSLDASMIFLHFTGLLSLCTATRLDFLVRGCLFTMMVLFEVLASADNKAKLFKSTVCSRAESQKYAVSPANVEKIAIRSAHEGLPSRESPLLPTGGQLVLSLPSYPNLEHRSISSLCRGQEENPAHSLSKQLRQFKFQTKYMCKRGTICSLGGGFHDPQRPAKEKAMSIGVCHAQRTPGCSVASTFQRKREMLLRVGRSRTTNGAAFLKHVLKDPDLIDELANFIECKEGKDYNAYLRNRAILRNRKYLKIRKRQWEKKKVVFNTMARGSCRKSSAKVLRDLKLNLQNCL